ncbi:TPA: hypothetical protein RRI20_005256 [Klebsiella pneumoniae]|nr:hypothetical protein [Klebsiella pneumoniae]
MTDFTELTQSEINGALSQLKQLSEYPTPVTQIRTDFFPIYFKYGGGKEEG